ncbi:MAG: tetratricopeptide repeat protein [Planctomycetota bacterium]
MTSFISRLLRPTMWTLVILALAAWMWIRQGPDFWATSDQRGQRRMNAGDPLGASELFQDPFHRGVALYRAGEFEQASQVFQLLNEEDGQFNYANSLVMLGQYDRAVEVYDSLLARQPNRRDAMNNRTIAEGRAERVRDRGGQMTDGQLGADEIVYGESTTKDSANADEEVVAGEPMTDAEMRGLWLRQVQTTPGEFLRAKFSYQNAIQTASNQEDRDD